MTLHFIPESEAEFLDSIEYYEDIESGLGLRFRDEILTVLEWIEQHSEKPRLRAGGYRRVNLKIFPFYIIYVIREPVLYIVAIPHVRRKPEFWKTRKLR